MNPCTRSRLLRLQYSAQLIQLLLKIILIKETEFDPYIVSNCGRVISVITLDCIKSALQMR